MKYRVWSRDRKSEVETHELTRTDKGTAYSDAKLLSIITGKRTWVEEING